MAEEQNSPNIQDDPQATQHIESAATTQAENTQAEDAQTMMRMYKEAL